MPLTKYVSAVTIITADVANSWFGGLFGTPEGDGLDPTDPLVAGHVHDGIHADGHAQKVDLVDHVTGKLRHANLADEAVRKRNIQAFRDESRAIPISEDIDGETFYYLDLSSFAGGGETLAETLAIGNETSGNSIQINDSDRLIFGDNEELFMAYVPSPTNLLFLGKFPAPEVSGTAPDSTRIVVATPNRSVNDLLGSPGSGSIEINTGETNTTGGGTGGDSGSISLSTGDADANSGTSGNSGEISATTGYSSNGLTGGISLRTGDGDSTGDIFLDSGDAGSGDSGTLRVRSGPAFSGGSSGVVELITGDCESDSGFIRLLTGTTSIGTSGDVYVGSGSGQSTGNVVINTFSANASLPTYFSGDITIETGNASGGATSGDITISVGSADTIADRGIITLDSDIVKLQGRTIDSSSFGTSWELKPSVSDSLNINHATSSNSFLSIDTGTTTDGVLYLGSKFSELSVFDTPSRTVVTRHSDFEVEGINLSRRLVLEEDFSLLPQTPASAGLFTNKNFSVVTPAAVDGDLAFGPNGALELNVPAAALDETVIEAAGLGGPLSRWDAIDWNTSAEVSIGAVISTPTIDVYSEFGVRPDTRFTDSVGPLAPGTAKMFLRFNPGAHPNWHLVTGDPGGFFPVDTGVAPTGFPQSIRLVLGPAGIVNVFIDGVYRVSSVAPLPPVHTMGTYYMGIRNVAGIAPVRMNVVKAYAAVNV